MSVTPIRIMGDPVLRTPAAPVVDFDTELQQLVADLTDTMHAAGGAGIAAPQIGVGLRVFTWYVDGEVGHLVNPSLQLSDETQDGAEADDQRQQLVPGEHHGADGGGDADQGGRTRLHGDRQHAPPARLPPLHSRGLIRRMSPHPQALFDAAPQAYLVFDRSMRVVAANRAYLASTHRALDELMGRDVGEVCLGDAETLALVRSAVRNGPDEQDAAERAAQVRRLRRLAGTD